MNLKGFKKIHEDDEKAILQNQRGHKITLAKSQLSKSHQDGLSRLPIYAADGADIPQEAAPQMEAPPEELAAPAEAPQEMAAPAQPQAEQQPAPWAQDPMPQMPQSPEQESKAHAAAHAMEADKEAVQYAQDLQNGHITPETYHSLYAKKDTLGKIGTLFGLMIAGAGSGLTHQPNAVLEMMNKQIDNDLQAQKQSKANAMNYYKLNQENELNKAQTKRVGAETKGIGLDTQLKADTHAKNQMLLGALQSMQNDVNKLPQGPQRIKAQQTLDGIRQAGAAEIQQNNIKMGDAITKDPEGEFQKKQKNLRMMGMLGMEGAETMARSNEEKHVAGFGESSVPVPGDVRQELIAKQEYDKAARKYIEFAKKHQSNWANLNPKERLEIAKKGAVLGAELQGKYRLKTHGGVYKEGEQEFIQRIIPDNATSWAASFNQIPKVEQTISNNQADLKNLAGGYGISTPKDQKTDNMPADGKTGTYKGKPVVMRNGKWEYK